ncbi:MAG: hypothetical protein KC729_20395, partial [Candidatus Eisenbacteria bacterium]|nr:hypothetical protein [Candidatus Eisenbacteria bacterium]
VSGGPILLGLALLVAVFAGGRFLPGAALWGANQFAYLPVWTYVTWLLCAIILLVPVGASRFARVWEPAGRWLLTSRIAPPLAALVMAGLGFVFGRSTHFLGDGTWLAANVESGQQFHFFDFVDYRLHLLVYRAAAGRIAADEVYRVGSVLAGAIAVFSQLLLVRRLPWEPWRKSWLVLLLLATPPVVLYFGYVESYSFLYAALTAFSIAGLLACEGVWPVWGASAFFGLGIFLHLSAVFSAPALLALGFLAPGRKGVRRWIEVVGPPAGFLILALLLYLASGYDLARFRAEFLHSSQGQSILAPLTGDGGIFSAGHWKDLGNTVLLTAPACVVVLLARARWIVRGVRSPVVGFLLVQILAVAFIRTIVDAKLGGAKDWDLVIAHSAAIPLLAGVVVTATRPVRSDGTAPRRIRGAMSAVLGISLVTTVAWILLQGYPDRSIARLIDVTADAPADTRTYDLEEVGRYYRDRQDYPRAIRLYEECVRRSPGHPRLRAQLGALYYLVQDFGPAKRELAEALRIDDGTQLALELLSEIELADGELSEAWRHTERLTQVAPGPPTTWELRGRVAMASQQWDEAVRAYTEAARRRPSAENVRQRAFALLRAERF